MQADATLAICPIFSPTQKNDTERKFQCPKGNWGGTQLSKVNAGKLDMLLIRYCRLFIQQDLCQKKRGKRTLKMEQIKMNLGSLHSELKMQ